MALKKLLSTLLLLLLLYTTLNYPPSTVAQCPYPCNPSPTTGGGNTPPATTMPPPVTTFPPPSQTGNYPPPAAVYTPPSTVFPYNPPTPIYYGGAPPPPDPIVPWFPFYYKYPPRNPRKSSAEDLRRSGSTVVVFLIHALVFLPLLRHSICGGCDDFDGCGEKDFVKDKFGNQEKCRGKNGNDFC